jgi:hypothetical protein
VFFSSFIAASLRRTNHAMEKGKNDNKTKKKNKRRKKH